MDILKAANEWAKAEILSTQFFIFFGILFLLGSIGFWQLGKTAVAKAFVYPFLVTGILLLILGVGLLFSTKSRLSNFETDYQKDAATFVKTEIARAENTIGSYKNVALKVFPLIIAVAALLIVFIDKPIWRAISIATIAMMLVMILVDSNALVRMQDYHKQLVLEEKNQKN